MTEASRCSSDISVNLSWKVFNEHLGKDHVNFKVVLNYRDEHFNKRHNLKVADSTGYRDFFEECLYSKTSLVRDVLFRQYVTF